jgi:homogentisate phytyltransferase/homogentisate geranylgeranyltransferase
MSILSIFWKFTRPHTVIGSVLSISTLYLVIYKFGNNFTISFYLASIILGVCTNLFIVGINQIADVEIDKINKPHLPIPSGLLSFRAAKQLIGVSVVISALLSAFINLYLFLIILLSIFIGWAYSMPPFYLKKHHVSAAFAIAFVRAILLNLGGFLVFNYLENQIIHIPYDIVILTFFVFLFSIVISWFKDLPDMKGDREYNIKTLAIAYSAKTAFKIGNLVVILAYLLAICFECYFTNLSNLSAKNFILILGHIVLLFLFVLNSFLIDLNETKSSAKFYKRFWFFFFAEYLLYLIAYLW